MLPFFVEHDMAECSWAEFPLFTTLQNRPESSDGRYVKLIASAEGSSSSEREESAISMSAISMSATGVVCLKWVFAILRQGQRALVKI